MLTLIARLKSDALRASSGLHPIHLTSGFLFQKARSIYIYCKGK